MSNWSPAQKEAIEARGGSILVSAAAGSGKTSVLVERVIRRIIDEGVDADRFLIVTFTVAAASELRSRIARAIDKEIAEKDDSDLRDRLIRQKNLLPLSKICTIDSFCQSVVKDNYQYLDIPPSFEVASDEEMSLYRDEILNETLEELYETASRENDERIFDLIELFSSDKDDSALAENIRLLQNKASAFPFFDEWLDSLKASFSPVPAFKFSPYGDLFFKRLEEELAPAKEKCVAALELLEGTEGLEKTYDIIASRKEIFDGLTEAIEEKDLDRVGRLVSSQLGKFSGGNIKEHLKPLKAEAQRLSNDSIEFIKKLNKIAYLFSEESFAEDMARLNGLVEVLVEVTKRFNERFFEYKLERNRFTFNDIMHFAVRLLAKQGNEPGSYEPTSLALEMRERFEEICIDEYQDTNETQNLIFEMIADNNLFCVGDAKQSIYKFRNAQPEIFIEKAEKYPDFDREENRFPAKIILKNNFRSRTGVTDFVNYVFSQIMSRQMGDIDYNADQELVASFDYQPMEEKVELHLFDVERSEDADKIVFEASYIADIISEKLESGFMIEDKATRTFRRCTPGDFTVLAGSVKAIGPALVDVLRSRGIGSFIEVESRFFESYEISLIMNLLRIIDNPRQDIPLLSVMLSAIFGFSPDELAGLRIEGEDRRADIYSLLAQKHGSDEKIASFMDRISHWRSLSYTMSAPEFIRLIYDETEIENLVLLMKQPTAKRANLSLLLHYASQYEKAGHIGLSGFIRYADKLENAKLDLNGSLENSSDPDTVKIMTIHKSKGLQAPIVILSMTHSKDSDKELSKPFVVSPRAGIGMKLKLQTDEGVDYIRPTLTHYIINGIETRAMKAEKMRLLYVALTRAEQRLIITGLKTNFNNTNGLNSFNAKSLAALLPDGTKRLDPLAAEKMSSSLERLFVSLLRHPEAEELRSLADLTNDDVAFREGGDFHLELFLSHSFDRTDIPEAEDEAAGEINEHYLSILNEVSAFEYEYLPLTKLISKQAASEVEELSVDNVYFASSEPSFLFEKGFTPAQRGTLTHAFMQHIDFDAVEVSDGVVAGVEKELDRMKSRAIFTAEEAEAIDLDAVKTFFASELAERMKRSPVLMREKKFTIHLPIDYYDSSLSRFPEEKLTVQGIADAVFEEDGKLVIVDYKTDRISNGDELVSRYRAQIKIYKEAMLQCTHYDEVKQMVLYSFHLDEAVEVND